MKIQKILIALILTLPTFSVNCMEEPIDREEQIQHKKDDYKLIPSLFDIIIFPFAKKAIEIYDEKGYSAMDEYLEDFANKCTLAKNDMLFKIISFIVHKLNKANIFGDELIRLYKDNPENLEIITNFFSIFDCEAQIKIIECIINTLTNLKDYCIDNPKFTMTLDENGKYHNIYHDPIVNLLTLLINPNRKIKFYNEIGWFLIRAENQLDQSQIVIRSVPNQSEQFTYTFMEPGFCIVTVSQEVYNNPQALDKIKDIFTNPLCIYIDYLRFSVKSLLNLIRTILDNYTESEITSEIDHQEYLETQGAYLLSLFDQYTNGDFDNKKKIEEEYINFINNIEKNSLREIIDYLFKTKFINKENQVCVAKFLGFIYRNESDRNKELLQRLLMLEKKYPESFKLIYQKHIAALLPHIKTISLIEEALSENIANKLKQLILNNPNHENNNAIIAELNYYYNELSFDFINELLDFMVQYFFEDVFDNKTLRIALNDLKDIILQFAEKNNIDEAEFNSELRMIDDLIKRTE